MTIKKYSRNQRFTDDYEDRQAKPQKKDRSEKRIKNALRNVDVDALNQHVEYLDDEEIVSHILKLHPNWYEYISTRLQKLKYLAISE